MSSADRPLAAVGDLEEVVVPLHLGRNAPGGDVALRVAEHGVLDLDHVGAPVGEDHDRADGTNAKMATSTTLIPCIGVVTHVPPDLSPAVSIDHEDYGITAASCQPLCVAFDHDKSRPATEGGAMVSETSDGSPASGAELTGGAGDRWTPHEVGLTIAAAIAVASVALTQTSSIPLLPVLVEQTGSDIATVSWVASATLIASAVFNPIIGRLGDMHGKRPMALGCIVVTLVGSISGALAAESLTLLIVARFIQGIGSGLIPLTLAMLRDELPARRVATGSSMVIVGGTGIGAGFGPSLMGAVVDAGGVASVLWVSAAAGAISLILMASFSRPSAIRFPASFDNLGTVGLAVTLVTVLIAATKGASWGWTSPGVILLFATGTLVGMAWTWWERRVPAPIVDLRVSSRGPVLIAHLAGIVAGFSSFAMYIVVFNLVSLPTETGHGLGRSVVTAGLVQLPGAGALIVSVTVAARAIARWGGHAVVIGGGTVVAAGFVVSAVHHDSLIEVIGGLVLTNLGLGAVFCVTPILILNAVDVSEMAAVNAVNAVSRLLGSVAASAVGGAILASSSVVVKGITYPSSRAFVAVNLVAGSLAMFLVVLTSWRTRRIVRH